MTSVTAILFEMILRQTSLSYKQMCLQRPEKTENINVEWGSRHTTQVIALSRLSHTSVLPLPSWCVNSLITALARGIPPATKTGTLPSHNATATPVKKSLKKTYLASFQLNYFMIIPVRSFKSLEFMLELKRVDNFIVVIPCRSLCQLLLTFSGVESWSTVSKFGTRIFQKIEMLIIFF